MFKLNFLGLKNCEFNFFKENFLPCLFYENNLLKLMVLLTSGMIMQKNRLMTCHSSLHMSSVDGIIRLQTWYHKAYADDTEERVCSRILCRYDKDEGTEKRPSRIRGYKRGLNGVGATGR